MEISLDRKSDIKYRNPNLLYDYIIERTVDKNRKFYIFIDEIQLSYRVKNQEVDELLVPDEDGVMYVGIILFLLENIVEEMVR